jgi:uncharacterized protein (TIGR02453 family)
MHLRALTQFLQELNDNNNRAWFAMNQPRYAILREEFLAVVTALIGDIARFDPPVAGCNPKKALFRINRDLRFAADKSPYKTRFSAAIVPSDLKRPSAGGGPGYYLEIGAGGKLLFGAGEYMPPPPRLRAIRQHMIDDAAGFTRLLGNQRMRQTYGGLQQEGKLMRPPKGYPADAEHSEHLKLKSFFVWTETDLPFDQPERLVPALAAALKDALPLVSWLRTVRQPADAT